MLFLPDPPCDPRLLLCLPDDVFSLVSRFILPRDVCNLSLCCKSLYALASSENVWFIQCDKVGLVSQEDLVEWREGVSSYKALCRFLFSVKPLLGIWVHQNPESGNLVYVMPGFVSVVGCRIIPQELGPLGIHDGPIMWSSVFEVVGDFDGSTAFILHGREEGIDYVYHGSVKYIDKSCNVLLLEVEPREQVYGSGLLMSRSLRDSGVELSGKFCRSNSELSRLQRVCGNNQEMVTFSKLAFSDRSKLLEVTTSHVRQEVSNITAGPLFSRLKDDSDNFKKDLMLLKERRALLCDMYDLGCNQIDNEGNSVQVESNCLRDFSSLLHKEDDHTQSTKRKSLDGCFSGSLKRIFGKSSSINGSHAMSWELSSSGEMNYPHLEDFLKSSDAIRLTIKATTVKLYSDQSWPRMPDNWFALYKMPLRVPTEDQIYAGLWGGTFGWPPGNTSDFRPWPGKALFFVLLSYEEYQGQQQLIATKILEGSFLLLHPNGSAMFIVNINEPSSEPFPWDTDTDSFSANIVDTFTGEGSSGYVTWYPESNCGSLFVFENDLLAFVWKHSKDVLTLQRLNLQELLKKGKRVPSLPPMDNFSYLRKSVLNEFTGIG